MNVEQWPIGKVRPYPGNPRNNDDAVEAVARSLDEFGWQQPIVVDADGTVVVGHTRLKAAERLDMETVPVVVAKELTPAQVNAYRLADNKVGELATWDMDLLFAELDGLQTDFDMSGFGFDMEIPEDWFESRERNDDSREEGNDEYNAFLDKFKPKKTTDDCYTPERVYDAVADWVADEYGLDRSKFVRPFYPGGDFENERYPEGCVVVDNPPFSIMARIIRFYAKKGTPFFLFANGLTLFNIIWENGVCAIPVGVSVRYENGANVSTSFVTNLEQGLKVRSAPKLYNVVKDANEEVLRETVKELPSYEFPDSVLTGASVQRLSKYGVDFAVEDCQCVHVRTLDAMSESGASGIFGGGLLLSDKAAAERAAAERAAAERAAAERASKTTWRLSSRELDIIASLG